MRQARAILILLALVGSMGAACAQGTYDYGLPPPSGSQNPVLPPPSGSQNPVLPPQSGQRYLPGVGGAFGEGARPSVAPRRYRGGDDTSLAGQLSPTTRAFEGSEIDRLGDIAPALRRCWNPPALDGPTDGAMATVRFSLRRDGSLFGQPRVSWGTRRSDPALQERFTQSVVAAIRACTPLRLSQRFGASIAGRPFSIRFHGRAPSNERQI